MSDGETRRGAAEGRLRRSETLRVETPTGRPKRKPDVPGSVPPLASTPMSLRTEWLNEGFALRNAWTMSTERVGSPEKGKRKR